MAIERQQKNNFEQTGNYFKQVWDELKKTTWPTWPEALRLTYVVIAVIVSVGIYMGFMDALLRIIMGKLIGQ